MRQTLLRSSAPYRGPWGSTAVAWCCKADGSVHRHACAVQRTTTDGVDGQHQAALGQHEGSTRSHTTLACCHGRPGRTEARDGRTAQGVCGRARPAAWPPQGPAAGPLVPLCRMPLTIPATLPHDHHHVPTMRLPLGSPTACASGPPAARRPQFVREFAKLGLTRSVGGVLALALSRELTPVVTAIILAGRVGSAFAAELGTMQVGVRQGGGWRGIRRKQAYTGAAVAMVVVYR